MNISKTNHFKVIEVDQAANRTPMIRLENSITKKELSTIGSVLEEQYQIGEEYLLFITEGTPYEEALHIILLDRQLSQKDHVEISANYSPGILKNLSVYQPNVIKFSFFNNEETWTLKMREKAKTCLWAQKYPIKRKSPFLKKSWIDIEKS